MGRRDPHRHYRQGDLFALPQHIITYARTIFSQLGDDGLLQNRSRRQFIDRLAFYFAEINALHPFREGNGRTQRAFLKQLSRQAGWDIDWRLMSSDENLRASIASMHGDLDAVTQILDRIVHRSKAPT